MCAGNTYNEALVQGFSEVLERFVLVYMHKNDISLPNIPNEYYSKYTELNEIIKYIENQGIKITIKDASLGKGFPVVCTVFSNIKDDSYIINLGAHLSLPIAIERTLTEFLQGFDISKEDSKDIFLNKNLKRKNDDAFYPIRDASISTRMFILKPSFFADKPSYEFDVKLWENKETQTNKESLKYLIDFCLQYSDDIFIRDVSFLGFPSYQILIPELSTLYEYDEEKLEKAINYFECKKEIKNNKIEKLETRNILNALEYGMNFLSSFQLFNNIEDEYSALICSIELKEYEKAIYYLNKILNSNKTDKATKTMCEILKEYITLKIKQTTIEEIRNILYNSYPKETIDFIINIFIENNSTNIIKKMHNGYKSPKKNYDKTTENIAREKICKKYLLYKQKKCLQSLQTSNKHEDIKRESKKNFFIIILPKMAD